MSGGAGGSGRIDVAVCEDLAARLRASPGPVVTAVVAMPAAATDVALIRATIAAIAFERAPAARVNAVLAAPGTPADAVAGAVAYLGGAVAVTGLTLEL